MTDGLGLVPLDLRHPYGGQADLPPGRRNGALRPYQVSGLSALPGDLQDGRVAACHRAPDRPVGIGESALPALACRDHGLGPFQTALSAELLLNGVRCEGRPEAAP